MNRLQTLLRLHDTAYEYLTRAYTAEKRVAELEKEVTALRQKLREAKV